jgi:hypothetical protein
MRPICIENLNYIVQKIPRQRVDPRTRHALSGVGPCRATDDTVQLSGAVKSWPGLAGSTIILPSVFPARDTSMASRCSPSSSTKVSWRWCGRQLSGCRRRRPWGTGGAGATRVAASLSATRKRRPSTKRSSANRRARVTERRRKHRPHSTELLSGLKLRGEPRTLYLPLCRRLTYVANGPVSFTWRILAAFAGQAGLRRTQNSWIARVMHEVSSCRLTLATTRAECEYTARCRWTTEVAHEMRERFWRTPLFRPQGCDWLPNYPPPGLDGLRPHSISTVPVRSCARR